MRDFLSATISTIVFIACSGGGNGGVVAASGGHTQGDFVSVGGVSSTGGAANRGGTIGASTATGGSKVGGLTATSKGGTVAFGGSRSTGGRSAVSGVNGTNTGGGIATSGAITGGTASGGSPIGTGRTSRTSITGGRANLGGGGGQTGGLSAIGGTGDPSDPEDFVPGTAPVAAKYFKKGINLGNRLEAPNEGDWGGRILDTDLAFIASRGFDHVRIPIRFSGHASTGTPYTIDAAFFGRVDTVLEQANQAKLAVVIDLHAYDELAASPSGERERFLSLWSQIATRYRDRPETVAFELLNEPNSQLDTAWNELVQAAVQVIRTTNPRRLLVVDSVFWADPSRLSQLSLPNDANIMVAIHLYEPKLFSFQGKSWMGPEYMTTGIVFPGPPSTPVTPVAEATAASWAKSWFDSYNTKPAATNPSGPATIAAQMAYINSYRSSSGRTVYNGEWGPQDGGELASRARLVTSVRQECEKAGVGWAIWEDPNNMKLFDSVAKTWVTAIVDAALPP